MTANTTYVAQGGAHTSANSNAAAGNITLASASDDLIMVLITATGGATLSGLPVSSIGATVIADVPFATDATHANLGFGVYRVHNAGTTPQKITASFTGTVDCYTYYIDAANVGSFDQVAASYEGSSSTAFQTNALKPAAAGALVLAFGNAVNASIAASSWANGFTALSAYSTGPSYWGAYLDQATDASVEAAATLSGSPSFTGHVLSYVPAASVALSVSSINGGSPIAEGATNVAIVGAGFAPGMTAVITQPGGCSVSQPVTYVSSTAATFNLVMEPETGDQLAYTDATYVTDITVTVGASASTPLAVTLSPASGLVFETLGTPNTDSDYRITADPDLSSGNQLRASGNVSGTSAAPTGLSINSDATWEFADGDTPANFYVSAYDQSTFTWGTWALQTAVASGVTITVSTNLVLAINQLYNLLNG